MKKVLLIALASVAVVALLLWQKPDLVVKLTFPPLPTLADTRDSLSEQDQGWLRFPSKTPYDLDDLLNDPAMGTDAAGAGTLHLPVQASADNPVPLMIVIHGSGGISPGREESYVELLNSQGIGAFVLDYYTPRAVEGDVPYMTKVLGVTEFDVISDAYHALTLLRTHPAIDDDRIGMMGMSYGGMATRFAMDSRIKQKLIGDQPGFKLYIDVYGPCFQNLQSEAIEPGPLLTLRGTEDASNELSACAKREDEIRAQGNIVETVVYEGAGHAWENDAERLMKKDAPYVVGCEMRYSTEGLPYVGDQAVIALPADASREQRIVSRMRSSSVLQDCVQYGYIMGEDEATQAKANQRILHFLDQYL